jgi:hypothetical protein
LTQRLRGVLSSLEFNNFGEAISDPEFKEVPRLLANNCYTNGIDAIFARSARSDVIGDPRFNVDDANIFVFLGKDGQPLFDKLVGSAVIELSPHPTDQATATAESLSALPNLTERGLAKHDGE